MASHRVEKAAADRAFHPKRYAAMSDTIASNNVCVYYGSTEALTDDHIPPKTLFPKARPANLITVRSCRSCNEGASKDDEYFRLVISMRNDSGDHPAVKKTIPSIYRSFAKIKQERIPTSPVQQHV
jgi:hypothetical protein